MAINQNDIVADVLTKTVQAVTNILDALDTIEAAQEQLTGAGIELGNFTAVIEAGSGLKHCDVATYINVLADFAPEIATHMKAYYSGSPTQNGWAALQKVRR